MRSAMPSASQSGGCTSHQEEAAQQKGTSGAPVAGGGHHAREGRLVARALAAVPHAGLGVQVLRLRCTWRAWIGMEQQHEYMERMGWMAKRWSNTVLVDCSAACC